MGKLISNQYNKIIPALKSGMTTNNYSDNIKNLYQDKIDSGFEFASNYYIIGKENDLGVYEDLGVRLIAPYQIGASSSLKDDYKTMIHKNYNVQLYLGERYFFDGNYYITIDTGKSKSASTSCLVQRCGDSLRFYDDLGVYHSIPAIIGKSGIYDLNSDTVLQLPDNQLKVLVKYDLESNLIKWADANNADQKYTRFLLHGQAYRVTSIDKSSFIRNDKGYIDIRLQADLIKLSDNLTLNIADDVQGVTLDILNQNTTIGVNQTLQLNTSIKRNGVIIDSSLITYSLSDYSKCSINQSGLIKGISIGTTIVTATYAGVSDSVIITVGATTNNYTVDFTSSNSNTSNIFIGEQVTYVAYPKNNGEPYISLCAFNLVDDDGISNTDVAEIINQTSSQITIKASVNSVNIGKYFKIKCINAEKTDFIRLCIKSIF